MAQQHSAFNSMLSAARWDWYQVTIDANNLPLLVPHLERAFPLASWRHSRPQHGYTQGQELAAGDRVQCKVWLGGNRGTANITSSSQDSPALARALALWGGPFKPTRVDACLDWEEPGLFDALAASLTEFAIERGIHPRHEGLWPLGKSRTLYIGSDSSPVQLCLYEKGYQMGGLDTKQPHWVRLEVRVQPDRRRRAALMRWSPADAFGAGWVPDAVERFFLIPSARFPVGYVKAPTDREKRREWLLKAGSRAIREWIEDCGGDTDLFGHEVAMRLLEAQTD